MIQKATFLMKGFYDARLFLIPIIIKAAKQLKWHHLLCPFLTPVQCLDLKKHLTQRLFHSSHHILLEFKVMT